jgi:hypothetical protein
MDHKSLAMDDAGLSQTLAQSETIMDDNDRANERLAGKRRRQPPLNHEDTTEVPSSEAKKRKSRRITQQDSGIGLMASTSTAAALTSASASRLSQGNAISTRQQNQRNNEPLDTTGWPKPKGSQSKLKAGTKAFPATKGKPSARTSQSANASTGGKPARDILAKKGARVHIGSKVEEEPGWTAPEADGDVEATFAELALRMGGKFNK